MLRIYYSAAAILMGACALTMVTYCADYSATCMRPCLPTAVLSADTLLLTVLVLSVHGMYELAIGTMSASRYAVRGHLSSVHHGSTSAGHVTWS